MTDDAATVRFVGRYAIHRPIARGGMATVFLGRLVGPVGFARTVAIKRLHEPYATDPKFVAMFLDEARLVARVRHPHVVPTLDVVATNGELLIVMEYVHGESLARLLRATADRGTTIPVPIVVAVMSGVLQGLHAAHEATSERGVPLNIVHRDVSPQNILVGRDGHARLVDFGVARAEERLHVTQEGLVKGKLAYMAPEQVRAERVTAAADVYAAGVVLWEALTGRALFRGAGDGGMVVEVLEGKVTAPSALLRDLGDDARALAVEPLDDLVLRSLARKPAERWASGRDFARGLEALVPPATTAHVSDWVETEVGATLLERAALVAEMESQSAIELTADDLGAAIARTTEPRAGEDVPESSVAPTTAEPPRHVSQEAAPSTTADPQPTTVPLDTTKDAAPPIMSAPPVTAPRPGAPLRPLPGTLVSAPSPVAQVDRAEPPRLVSTLQSIPAPAKRDVVSTVPLAATKPAAEAALPARAPKRALAPARVSVPSATPPKKGRRALLGFVLVVIGGAAAGYFYAGFTMSHRGAEPIDRARLSPEGATPHAVMGDKPPGK